MTQQELNEILEKHKKWLNNEEGGERADLRRANLCGADLRGAVLPGADLRRANLCGADLPGAVLRRANLCEADLRGADLRRADLCGANLRGADLRRANLCEADLRGANLCESDQCRANLRGADLRRANLCEANLHGADLLGAKIDGVKYNEGTAFFALQCPEEGEFVGYKKACGYIVKLLIPKDAKRSSATSRKCRCSKAKVLSITDKDGSNSGINKVTSNYDSNFVYEVGKTVMVSNFNEDRWNECSTGIHFFITRQEAVNYE